MDHEKGNEKRRDDVYSQSLRAGKRTYFFDVKSTKSEDLYLTITESKRRFNNENGKLFYEKHKLFLYPEDFESFTNYLNDTLEEIKKLSGGKEITTREEMEAMRAEEQAFDDEEEQEKKSSYSADINFEDLEDDETTES